MGAEGGGRQLQVGGVGGEQERQQEKGKRKSWSSALSAVYPELKKPEVMFPIEKGAVVEGGDSGLPSLYCHGRHIQRFFLKSSVLEKGDLAVTLKFITKKEMKSPALTITG